MSSSLWKDIRGPLYQKMEALVLQAQEEGVISKQFKANHLIVSFMGMIIFYFTEAQTLKDIFQAPLGKKALEERKEQVVLLFEKILK